MKILFIVRSFAPDSIIAAMRPTKLAKYLSKSGHEVMVIRSGNIVGIPSRRGIEDICDLKVYSYNGVDSKADRYERGEDLSQKKPSSIKSRTLKNTSFYKCVVRAKHIVIDPFLYYKNDGFDVERKILELYKTNPELRKCDVIISSFSPLGCIKAGERISKIEKAVWIIDFRDLMDNQGYSPVIRCINRELQKMYLKKADACLCVSNGNSRRLANMLNGTYAHKVYTLFNGFDKRDEYNVTGKESQSKLLRLCYTGTIHEKLQDFTPLFRVIKSIPLSIPIQLDYAGNSFNVLMKQAEEFGVSSIICNHGYLSRDEVSRLQINTDLFIVLSWNNTNDQGILTGKLYESILYKKPVVALVTGDMPNSELKELIDRYRLGVCYEEATPMQSEHSLKEYIIKQYEHKMNMEEIEYSPDERVYNMFEYNKLAHRLEGIINDVTRMKNR